ncbi:MAG: hypothetical protein ACTIJR_14800 [Brevibacterium linens]
MAERHYDKHVEPVWLTDLARNLAHMPDIETRTEEDTTLIARAAEILALRDAGGLSEKEQRARTNAIWYPAHFFTVPLLLVLLLGKHAIDVGSLILLVASLFCLVWSIAPVLEYLQIGYRDGRILRTEVEYRIVR